MKQISIFVKNNITNRPNLVNIIDNIGWLLVDRILRMSVGLFVGVWVARYLGPEGFGILNYATAFISLFGAFAGLGLRNIVVQDLIHEPTKSEEIIGAAAKLQLLSGLIAYALSILCIVLVKSNDKTTQVLVSILGLTLTLKASEIIVCWYESKILSKYVVWIQNGSFLFFALIKVILIKQNLSLISFAITTTAESTMIAVLLIILAKRQGFQISISNSTIEKAKHLLKQSWPLLLSSIGIMVYMKIDQIMLGQMSGNKSVGIYSAAVRICEVWYFIPNMIVATVFPLILKEKKCSLIQYYKKIQILFSVLSFTAVLIIVPMTLFSDNIINLLFGSAYPEASAVLHIYIWATLFVFLGVASDRWLIAENLQILSLQRTLIGVTINIILNYILIPINGAIGAAIATLIAQATVGFFFDSFQKKTRHIFLQKLKSLNPIMFFYIKRM